MKEDFMKKIIYKERAVKAILAYLETTDATFTLHEESIVIDANKDNEEKIFKRLNGIISTTKYMVQKEITTFTITVFNGSV